MRVVNGLFVVGALLFVFGIGFVVVGARSARDVPGTAGATPTLAPVATIKQLMNGIVVPASTRVYDAVSSTVTEKGVEDIVPRDDQEWAAVGDSAAALAEAGNLLMMDGRAVDRGEWMTITQAMIAASKATLAAVDAKSPEAVLKAGSELNTTCDNCHMRYQR